jgi:hypothetical protein
MGAKWVSSTETTLEILVVIANDLNAQLLENILLRTPASLSGRGALRRGALEPARTKSRGSPCSITASPEHGPDSMRAAAPRSICRPAALSLPAVMQRLRVLKDSGLVRSETSCCVRTCRIVPLERLMVVLNPMSGIEVRTSARGWASRRASRSAARLACSLRTSLSWAATP